MHRGATIPAWASRRGSVETQQLGLRGFAAKSTAQTEPSSRRAARPLARTQSINSGSTLLDEGKKEGIAAPSSQDRVSKSLVGSNVHGTYNAQRERSLWMKKPLFARPGDSGFSSGKEAADKLEAEALRRDPYQVDFLESLRDVTRSITPMIEQNPKLAWVMKQMMEPEKFLTFRVSWKDDDNNWRMNRGYCVNYSSAIGPFKGPLRFDHRITHGSIRMLAFEQVLKHALITNENWGGATGGADLDVSNRSPEELRRFSQAFSNALGETFGQKNDVLFPAADMDQPAGKFSAAVAHEVATQIYGPTHLQGKRCVISGSSKKSFTLAKQLLKIGAIPMSFSDSTGFLIDKNGLSLDAVDSLERLLANFGRLEDFRHVSKTCTFHPLDSGTSLWESVQADLAFASQAHSELSSDDAVALADGGCKAVFELSDRACSENAVRVFSDRSVAFAPSKLMLAAPIKHEAASDAEMTEYARSVVSNIMVTAQENGFAKIDLQAGACIVAFKRLAESDMFKL